MQLPDKEPLAENIVVTSAEELGDVLRMALKRGKGAFLKVFGKDDRAKYYMTLLFDSSKVLAAECLVVDTGEVLVGSDALERLKSLLGRPMVVDAYSLDEIELKLSVTDNLDVYSETPKIPLSQLCPKGWEEHEEEPSKNIAIRFTGGTLPKTAFEKYAEAILRDSSTIDGLEVEELDFDVTVGEGVAYVNVALKARLEDDDRANVVGRRLFHIISKNAPIILRETGHKPVLRDIKVVINGREIRPQEILERDRKKEGNVTSDGRIKLSVLEDVWPYFSNFAKSVVRDLEEAGIKVTKAYFDVRGRREFEINVSMAVESPYDEDTTRRRVRMAVTTRAKELSAEINRYISVRNIELQILEKRPTARPTGKAAEILAKKELLEREVERLLKEAGIEELAPLTEEKKREAEETLLRSRVEPAIETLKNRIHAELKLIPRVTFKWLKLNHEIEGTTVYVDIEASFLKENVGGLFGAYSGVSDERIKRDIVETITRIIKEVSSEYSVAIKPKKINVILH